MRLTKLIIKNFYSYKDVTVNFSKYSGMTLIKGVNKDSYGSNGAGKSALAEAIFFGLTGKTIRKSTEEAYVNNTSKKGCYVEVHIDDSIVIKRSKRPNKLDFIVDGVSQTKDTALQTQAFIDDLLNMNHKVLLTSMFFGQSNNLNFLDADAGDKRIILRNFLNLEEVFELRDKIKPIKSSFYQGMKVQDALIEEHQKNKDSIQSHMDKYEREESILSSGYENLNNVNLDDILDQEAKIREHKAKLSNLNSDLSSIKRKLEHLNNQDHESLCETCKQPLPDHWWDDHDWKISQLKVAAEELEEEKIKLGPEPERPEVSSREYSNLESLLGISAKLEAYREGIQTHSEAIVSCQNEKTKLNKQYEIMRFWEKAFSEQGLIKYIIRNVLSYFNNRINYYLSFLTTSSYHLEFDEELSEKILVSGKKVHYISLSGGEKRKMNLAVLLALRDLLSFTNKNQLDLVIFDEVAENLDEEGISGLHFLLNEIKQDKTVFIITHNKYLKTLLHSSPRLTITKSKGTSKIS